MITIKPIHPVRDNLSNSQLRPFVRATWYLLLLLVVGGNFSLRVSAAEFRAAWADVFHVGMQSSSQVDTMVNTLVSGKYNAVIVQVVAYMDKTNTASSHGAYWKSSILPWSSYVTSGFDPLAYLCTKAHASGIEVHAWLGGSGGGMYRVSTAWPPANNATLTAHPEWFMVPKVNSEGNSVTSLDGNYLLDMGSPDAQDYIVSIVKELVTNYQIDGINWDDEINTTGYNQGYGYPAYSQANYSKSGLARYRQNTGYVGTPSISDSTWSDYRRRFKNELIARCQAEIQSIKTNPRQPLRHSIAPIAYDPAPSSCTYTSLSSYVNYCDWFGMLANGYVDAAVPQFYRRQDSQATSFKNWIDYSYSCWQGNRHVFAGLGGYLNGMSNSVYQIRYALSGQSGGNGLSGISTYSYAAPTNASDGLGANWYSYVSTNLFTNTVSTPTMSWRSSATATQGIIWGQIKNAATGLFIDDGSVTVTGSGRSAVSTDGNGYYVVTMVPAASGGTSYSVTATKTGIPFHTINNAVVLPGDVVRYDIVLNAPPTDPSGLTANAGSSSQITLSWTDNSTNEMNFVIGRSSVSGGPYSDIAWPSADSTSFNDTGLSAGSTYYYVVRATNNAGTSANSSQATATTPGSTPVSITGEPQSQSVAVSSNVTFTVTASGTPPLLYQWRYNGNNINLATSSSYTRSNVQMSDAGSYSVIVSNTFGSDTSSDAVLTVVAAPSITVQPGNVTQNAGTLATFSVTATGGNLSYQWRKNSVALSDTGNISGAATANLTLSSISQSDAASYTVVITNIAGAATGGPATLTVIDPPSIVVQPRDWSLLAGRNATLRVTASGTSPLSYQWRLNGEDILDATNSSYAIANAQAAHAGTYSVLVSNGAGSAGSTDALVRVLNTNSGITLSNLWNIQAGTRNYVTTGSTERGLALNPFTDHVLVVSRSSALSGSLGIYILNADTGTELGTLSVSGVNNTGALKLNKAGVAEDGVIYAANVTTASSTSPFVIYRWASESAVPTTAYSGAPDSGTTARWGDSFAVKGSGTNTRIITAGSASTNVIIFTTSDGLTFTSHVINPSPAVSSGGFWGGLQFGEDETFYMKHRTTGLLRKYTYNLGANSASPTTDITVDSSILAITVDTNQDLFFGVRDDNSTNHTSHSLMGYNISNAASPVVISNFYFSSFGSNTNSSNSNFAGAADSDGDRVIALDTQNGIVALKLVSAISPYIVQQPTNQDLVTGDNATLTVSAGGDGPLTYQWKQNGAVISEGNVSGQTTVSLGITEATQANAGTYTVTVSNSSGSVTSDEAVLRIFDLPSIVAQPASQTLGTGTNGLFSVTATGTALSYQWYKNGTLLSNGGNISGATSDNLTVATAAQSDAGSYSVVISNIFETVTSDTAVLTVIDPPSINSSPANSTINASSLATFSGSASGGATLSYQWQKNGSNLSNDSKFSGTQTTTLSISNALKADEGSYRLVVSNSVGTRTSASATLTVNDPVITSQPANQIKVAGANATFSVSANGTAPLSYQWKKDNTPLSNGAHIFGATTAALTVSSVTASDAGSYAVDITNPAGAITSASATLTVLAAPVISGQPTNLLRKLADNATFAVIATGDDLTYQWRFNGTNIASATDSAYNLSNVQIANAGSYSVIVSNTVGTATSSNAILTVDSLVPALTITFPKKNQRLLENVTATNYMTVLKGTASDDRQLAQVLYSTNLGVSFAPVAGTTTWSTPLSLVPGTNTVVVKALDQAGNSTSITQSFTYVVPTSLTLHVVGNGTVMNSSGTALEVGKGYRLTTSVGAGTNYIFTNWTRVVNNTTNFFSSNPVLNFVMESNLALNANFIVNPFVQAEGTYNGLFYDPNDITRAGAGFFTMKLSRRLTFSGRVQVDGNSVGFSGKFPLDGSVATTIWRTNLAKNNLALSIILTNWTDRISGAISDTNWTATLSADRYVWSATHPADKYTNKYTVLIPGFSNPAQEPTGSGYMLVSVDSLGKVKMSGGLADGHTLGQTVVISTNGDWPLYVPLYKQPQGLSTEYEGLLLGSLAFETNTPAGKTNLAPQGTVTWIKEGWTNAIYSSGFAGSGAVRSSRFVPPPTGTRILSFTGGKISFTNGNLTTGFTNSFSLGLDNKVTLTLPVQNKLKVALVTSSGALSGSFMHPQKTNMTVKFFGAVLQDYNYARGYFVGTNQTGSVIVNGN